MTDTFIEVGIANFTLPGEPESGDRCVVRTWEDRALVAVIDGLGHGPEAAEAARAAVDVIEQHSHEHVGELMQRCHERLLVTRGAVITLLSFDRVARRLEWVGTGNVAAVLVRREPTGKVRREELLTRSGVAGVLLPSIEALSVSTVVGDVVVAATDGVSPAFIDSIGLEPSQQLADRLLSEYRMEHDDALVVAVRVRGARP